MAYKQMAGLYDQLMIEAPYDQWVGFTKEMIEQADIEVKRILDLGCGTGEVTTRLAKAGYNLTGVDYSGDMLTYAEAKASAEKQSIQWIRQDIRELDGFENMDLAISYCDVMNYLTTEDDLKMAFSHTASALKPNGLFIFDVHSLNHVHKNLINHVFTEVTEDICYIWDCDEGDELGEMFHDITFFSSDGKGKYHRFEEYHHQKTYSTDVYSKLLVEAGFEIPVIYGDFDIEKEFSTQNTERIFFVTQKRSR